MSDPLPKLITLEEHFVAKDLFTELSDIYSEQLKHLPEVSSRLQDVGPLRLANMDETRISLQIVSHAPGLGPRAPHLSRLANDHLAAAVRANAKRFLRFVGALVDAHVDGHHYDDRRFWPVFQAAAELDVPVYLHPTYPSESQRPAYEGNFDPGAARSMGSSGFGWHSETGLAVLKLFAAGLFDEYPSLKIIIGHFGEMLPFMMERVEKLSVRWGPRRRGWREVWEGNVWVTTSGVWGLAPLACVLRNTPVEHILYSVDYPFEKNENGLAWMRELRDSGMVTGEQLEMIAFRNAERLLRVQAP
ncbi:amidohydrolase 2 [Colletotrichum scovillei]|uniref:amidohydrolase 2 n=1 Tax=Colletotrichum scovillei TaxID=1209932 RepID=UPI0015C3EEE7|nr:amidohydrolase 2 [Colletotrichum scovillei]KAF4774122.1 amidohydrolase 2 [Colletotrichum scovillei]